MTDALLVAALILAAAMPLAFSHPAGLDRVRDWWLRGVALGSILLAPLFLAPIAAWFAWRWPAGPDETAGGEPEPWRWVPQIVVWTGLGMSWTLIARLEAAWWPWVAAGWVAWGVVQVGILSWRAWRVRQVFDRRLRPGQGFAWRQTGTYGTAVMTSLYLALVTPFVPLWLWPIWAVGLWLTCSWAACLAISIGALVYFIPWK